MTRAAGKQQLFALKLNRKCTKLNYWTQILVLHLFIQPSYEQEKI